MVGRRQVRAFHTGRDEKGRRLSVTEREQMMRPYLPADLANDDRQPSTTTRHIRFHHKQRVRPAIRHLIHNLIFILIHTVFSIYIRFRQAYHAIVDRVLAVLYYHHRTPELIQKDVKSLTKLPQHLSVILELPPEGGKTDRLETLVNDACEVAAWSASAGIPMVSVYEKTGAFIPRTLTFAPSNSRQASSSTPSHTSTAASPAPSRTTSAPPPLTNLPTRSAHPTSPPTALPSRPIHIQTAPLPSRKLIPTLPSSSSTPATAARPLSTSQRLWRKCLSTTNSASPILAPS